MPTELNFCTRCGHKVDPYSPSTSSYCDTGEKRPLGGADAFFWCNHCHAKHRATNLEDTGRSCPSCDAFMPMDNAFCAYCGERMEAPEKPPVRPPKPLDMRLFRLFRQPDDLRELAAQLQDLRAVVFNALQEIDVLKTMLKKKGAWDESLYKKLRVARMTADHSSAGASPWQRHSYYPFTLEDEAYLREELNLSEAEIAHYKEEIEFAMTQT